MNAYVVPVLKDDSLYLYVLKVGSCKKVDFPGKIVNVKNSGFPGFEINFVDESGLLYNLKNDMTYTKYDDIDDVKDFYMASDQYLYVIKFDGKLVMKKISPSGEFQEVFEANHISFVKIYGHNNVVIAIDEFGNLWSNVSDHSNNGVFTQITEGIVFVSAEVHYDTITAVDSDGNIYSFIFEIKVVDGRNSKALIKINKINIMGLQFIQFSACKKYLCVIDKNNNLLMGNLSKPFKLVKTNVSCIYYLDAYEILNILLTDGTFFSGYYKTVGNMEMSMTDIKFDKLPNIMYPEMRKRFKTTKSARKV